MLFYFKVNFIKFLNSESKTTKNYKRSNQYNTYKATKALHVIEVEDDKKNNTRNNNNKIKWQIWRHICMDSMEYRLSKFKNDIANQFGHNVFYKKVLIRAFYYLLEKRINTRILFLMTTYRRLLAERMVRWMCGVSLKKRKQTDDLYSFRYPERGWWWWDVADWDGLGIWRVRVGMIERRSVEMLRWEKFNVGAGKLGESM